MTADFVWSQVRAVAMAIIAYMAGAKMLTPEGAGLAVTVVTTLGPIAIPYLWTTYAVANSVRVEKGSVAEAVAKVEKVVGPAPVTLAKVAEQAAVIKSNGNNGTGT